MNTKDVLIIAEVGVNHNGSIETAKKLIDIAKDAGVDIVKFQTANLDSLVSKDATMAEYQKQNIGIENHRKKCGALENTAEQSEEPDETGNQP